MRYKHKEAHATLDFIKLLIAEQDVKPENHILMLPQKIYFELCMGTGLLRDNLFGFQVEVGSLNIEFVKRDILPFDALE